MERETNLTDKIFPRLKHALFIGVEVIHLIEGFQGFPVMTGGNPANHLDIPQAARTVFYMGLKIVFCVGKFIVAFIGFTKLGEVEGLAVPHRGGPHLATECW